MTLILKTKKRLFAAAQIIPLSLYLCFLGNLMRIMTSNGGAKPTMATYEYFSPFLRGFMFALVAAFILSKILQMIFIKKVVWTDYSVNREQQKSIIKSTRVFGFIQIIGVSTLAMLLVSSIAGLAGVNFSLNLLSVLSILPLFFIPTILLIVWAIRNNAYDKKQDKWRGGELWTLFRKNTLEEGYLGRRPMDNPPSFLPPHIFWSLNFRKTEKAQYFNDLEVDNQDGYLEDLDGVERAKFIREKRIYLQNKLSCWLDDNGEKWYTVNVHTKEFPEDIKHGFYCKIREIFVEDSTIENVMMAQKSARAIKERRPLLDGISEQDVNPEWISLKNISVADESFKNFERKIRSARIAAVESKDDRVEIEQS